MNNIGLILNRSQFKTFAVTASGVSVNPPELPQDACWYASTPTSYPEATIASWMDSRALYELSDTMELEEAKIVVKDMQAVIPNTVLQPGKTLNRCLFTYIPWVYQSTLPVPPALTNILDTVRVGFPKEATQTKTTTIPVDAIEYLRLPLSFDQRRAIKAPRTFKPSKPAIYEIKLLGPTSENTKTKLFDRLYGETLVVTNNQLVAMREYVEFEMIDSMQITTRVNDWVPIYEHPAFARFKAHRETLKNMRQRNTLDKHVVALVTNLPTDYEHPYSLLVKGQLWARTLQLAIETEGEGQNVTSISYDTIWTEG